MKCFATFLILALCLASGHSQVDDRDRENPLPRDEYAQEFQLVFFAVLEGLYRDGVSGEALDLILPNSEEMLIPDAPEMTNFVYNCPLCAATYNALKLYAARTEFYGQKTTRYNTFGPGVSEEVLAKLKASPRERRDTIQALIQKWVSYRLDDMVLTIEEREEIEGNLNKMKERGDELLARFKAEEEDNNLLKYYSEWEHCPACEGATAMGVMTTP